MNDRYKRKYKKCGKFVLEDHAIWVGQNSRGTKNQLGLC
jgi:hypothetical protein